MSDDMRVILVYEGEGRLAVMPCQRAEGAARRGECDAHGCAGPVAHLRPDGILACAGALWQASGRFRRMPVGCTAGQLGAALAWADRFIDQWPNAGDIAEDDGADNVNTMAVEAAGRAYFNSAGHYDPFKYRGTVDQKSHDGDERGKKPALASWLRCSYFWSLASFWKYNTAAVLVLDHSHGTMSSTALDLSLERPDALRMGSDPIGDVTLAQAPLDAGPEAVGECVLTTFRRLVGFMTAHPQFCHNGPNMIPAHCDDGRSLWYPNPVGAAACEDLRAAKGGQWRDEATEPDIVARFLAPAAHGEGTITLRELPVPAGIVGGDSWTGFLDARRMEFEHKFGEGDYRVEPCEGIAMRLRETYETPEWSVTTLFAVDNDTQGIGMMGGDPTGERRMILCTLHIHRTGANPPRFTALIKLFDRIRAAAVFTPNATDTAEANRRLKKAKLPPIIPAPPSQDILRYGDSFVVFPHDGTETEVYSAGSASRRGGAEWIARILGWAALKPALLPTADWYRIIPDNPHGHLHDYRQGRAAETPVSSVISASAGRQIRIGWCASLKDDLRYCDCGRPFLLPGIPLRDLSRRFAARVDAENRGFDQTVLECGEFDATVFHGAAESDENGETGGEAEWSPALTTFPPVEDEPGFVTVWDCRQVLFSTADDAPFQVRRIPLARIPTGRGPAFVADTLGRLGKGVDDSDTMLWWDPSRLDAPLPEGVTRLEPVPPGPRLPRRDPARKFWSLLSIGGGRALAFPDVLSEYEGDEDEEFLEADWGLATFNGEYMAVDWRKRTILAALRIGGMDFFDLHAAGFWPCYEPLGLFTWRYCRHERGAELTVYAGVLPDGTTVGCSLTVPDEYAHLRRVKRFEREQRLICASCELYDAGNVEEPQ